MKEQIKLFIKEREERQERMFEMYGVNTPRIEPPTFEEFIDWILK